MRIIKHRVNTLKELAGLTETWGAEMDLRSTDSGELIVTHDAFTQGDPFETWLTRWSEKTRGTLILNPKEDGIEDRALALLKQFNIKDYFFLDLSFPTTVRLTMKQGISDVAIRVSEYESAETALLFAGKAKWVWLDCFSPTPPSQSTLELLRKDFKLCLVSPELHNREKDSIQPFLSLTPTVDAVCTKFPELWL